MGKITMLFNNVEGDKRLRTGWGQSILVEQGARSILFDVGPSAEDLFCNMDVLGIDKGRIDSVAISHPHHDHAGALEEVLQAALKTLEVYRTPQAKKEIASGIYIFPVKGFSCVENALVIDSPRGIILLTGCAHPGIYAIARKARLEFGKNIYAVIGGFHLEYYPGFLVRVIGLLLKNLGVQVMAPGHCTGERAMRVLKEVFKDGFLDFGCGGIFEY